MFANWIRDELKGMPIDFDRSDIDWIVTQFSDIELEEAFGDNADSAFWDEFRDSVREMATELLFARDSE